MGEQTPDSDEPLPFRPANGGDLALAFFGSIAVGAMSPAIPALCSGLLSYFLAASMVCGFLGFFWGYLTVIIAAAVEHKHRRATTLWMFAIQSIFAMGIGWWVVHVAAYA